MSTYVSTALQEFLKQNKLSSLDDINLSNKKQVDGLNWDGFDQEQFLPQLKANKRLSKLTNDSTAIEALSKANLTSAQHIAEIPENRFVSDYEDKLGGADAARKIHKKAQNIQARVHLMAANVKDGVASKHYTATAFGNTESLSAYQQMPDYEELFGDIDYCTCSECSSVYGPAAYFVDLMRIINTYISSANQSIYKKDSGKGLSLLERRPDLFKLELNCDNTNKEIPYLELVVNVLKHKLFFDLKDDIQAQGQRGTLPYLALNRWPFNTAINEPIVQIDQYLQFFKLSYEELLQLFNQSSEVLGQAALHLGYDERQWITKKDISEDSLRTFWGTSWLSKLQEVEHFSMDSGLSLPQIEFLFYQNLSEKERKSNKGELAHELFINKYVPSDGFLHLQKNQTVIGPGKMNDKTRDRLHRFIRLSNLLEWSFEDLDWALRTFSAEDIDEKVFGQITRVASLGRDLSLSVLEMTALWNDLKTTGEDENSSFFDQVFNSPTGFLDTNGSTGKNTIALIYHPKYDKNSTYKSRVIKLPLENIKKPNDLRLQQSLLAALNIKAKDLLAIATYLSEKVGDKQVGSSLPLDVPHLSILYRLARLSQALKIRVTDLITLVELLCFKTKEVTDKNGKKQKEVTYPTHIALYQSEDINSLVQFLRKNKLSIADFVYFCKGKEGENTQYGRSKVKLEDVIQNLKVLSSAWVFTAEDLKGAFESSIADNIFSSMKKLKTSFSKKGVFYDQTLVKSAVAVVPCFDEKLIQSWEVLKSKADVATFVKGIGVLWTQEVNGKDTTGKGTSELIGKEFIGKVFSKYLSDYSKKEVADGKSQLYSQLNKAIDQLFEILSKSQEKQINNIYEWLASFSKLKIDQVKDLVAVVNMLRDGSSTSKESLDQSVTQLFISLDDSDKLKNYLDLFFRFADVSQKMKWKTDEFTLFSSYPSLFATANQLPSLKKVSMNADTAWKLLTSFSELGEMLSVQQNKKDWIKAIDYIYQEEGAETKKELEKDEKLKRLLSTAYGQSVNEVAALYTYLDSKALNISKLYWFYEVFGVTDKIGASVELLTQLVGLASTSMIQDTGKKKLSNWGNFQQRVAALESAIQVHVSDKRWNQIFEKTSRIMQAKLRNVMVPILLKKLQNSDIQFQIDNEDDLYAYLLIDVEMSTCMNTSFVSQAIASAQLFIQRTRLHMEPQISISSDFNESWWAWMNSFATWQANRKVFLYPEDYFNPALPSKSQTPLFLELKQQLSQNPITQENIENAYKKYLASLTNLAKLKVVGTHFTTNTLDEEEQSLPTLFMVGRTLTPSYKYYLRSVNFVGSKAKPTNWTQWSELNVKINSDYVSPVYVYDKLFLFWVEIRTGSSDGNNNNTPATLDAQIEGKGQTYNVDIKYTYQLPNGEWSGTQALVSDMLIGFVPTDSSSSKYINKVQDSLSNMYLDNDYSQSIWNEVYPIAVNTKGKPTQENTDEDHNPDALVIMYGSLPVIPQEALDTPDNPSSSDFYSRNPDLNNYNQSLYQLIMRGVAAQKSGLTGTLSLVNVVSLNSNLRSSTTNVVFKNYKGSHFYKSFVDTSIGSFGMTPSNNPLTDNFLVDDNTQAGNVAIFFGGAKFKSDKLKNKISELVKDDDKFIEDYLDGTSTHVDIYNPITGSIQTSQMNTAGHNSDGFGVFNISAARNGNKFFFGGGITPKKTYSNRVNIYNADTNSWSNITLPHGRVDMGVASIGNLVLFAGGQKHHGSPYNKVDIYDVEKGDWKDSQDFNEVSRMGTTVVGNYALFAGGSDKKGNATSNTVVYNALEEKWSTTSIMDKDGAKHTRSGLTATSAGNYALFAGGVDKDSNNEFRRDVFIYDVVNDTWDKQKILDDGIMFGAAGSTGRFAVFAGGIRSDGEMTAKAYIFDSVTQKWDKCSMPGDRGFMSATSAAGKIVFAGGFKKDNGNAPSSFVYIFDPEAYIQNDFNSDFAWTSRDCMSTDRGFMPSVTTNTSLTLLEQIDIDKASTLSVKNKTDWFIFDNGDESFLVMPKETGLSAITDHLGNSKQNLSGSKNEVLNLTKSVYDDTSDLWKQQFEFIRLSTFVPEKLSSVLTRGGVDSLISLHSQKTKELPFKRFFHGDNMPAAVVAPKQELDFNGAYGAYFSELFFDIPFYLANKMQESSNFEGASAWYQYIFNPTEKGESADRFWRYKPLRNVNEGKLWEVLTSQSNISAYDNDPFDPDALVSLRPISMQKAIVIQYIKNLLSWGDQQFTLDTRETITQATMLYIQAKDLLGPAPKAEGTCASEVTTFGKILANYDKEDKNIPQFLIQLEDKVKGEKEGIRLSSKPYNDINAVFCIPPDLSFVNLWKEVDDRLYKIRHCENIDGQKQDLPLYPAAINPNEIIDGLASGENLSQITSQLTPVIPPVRFNVVLQQAKGFISNLTELGSGLLSALEKKDAESFTYLQTTQAYQLQQLSQSINQMQIENAQDSLNALNDNLQSAQYRVDYYKGLISAGWNVWENNNIDQMNDGITLNIIAEDIKLISGAAFLLADIFGLADGGMQFGQAVDAIANALDVMANVSYQGAQVSGIIGGFERRSEDWELQQKLAEFDTSQFQNQIAASEVQLKIAKNQYSNLQVQIKQYEEQLQFLKTKFTNAELYDWMIGKISTIYYQTYQLSLHMVSYVQVCYQYEMVSTKNFINYNYWDADHKGLLAGETLKYALSQIENAYLNENVRYQEITKTISLKNTQGEKSLDQFIKTQRCTIDLTQDMFDLDYPNHYRRKIKTISVTIPAVVGPYQDIHASLTQVSNYILMEPDQEGEAFLSKNQNGQQPSSVRSNYNANQQISLSNGNQDTGLFQLNFDDNMYLPFEGTGAISTWVLDMPAANNKSLNYESISDVILTVKYQALVGGSK